MDNPHENHRERMRAKYEAAGDKGLATHEILEMMLYTSIPRSNTNEIAHEILKNFPSTSLFQAPLANISNVKGLGEKSAFNIKASLDFSRRLLCDGFRKAGLNDEFRLRSYIFYTMLAYPCESLSVFFFSKNMNLLLEKSFNYDRLPHIDTLTEIIKECCGKTKAKSIVLSHSHGDGTAEPSPEDLFLTSFVKKELDKAGVALTAHYIVTASGCNPMNFS